MLYDDVMMLYDDVMTLDDNVMMFYDDVMNKSSIQSKDNLQVRMWLVLLQLKTRFFRVE